MRMDTLKVEVPYKVAELLAQGYDVIRINRLRGDIFVIEYGRGVDV